VAGRAAGPRAPRHPATPPPRIDHHGRRHGVECLDDAQMKKRALQDLAERTRVFDEQRQWKTTTDIDRIGDVDQRLAR
jgi:hypothetical protein